MMPQIARRSFTVFAAAIAFLPFVMFHAAVAQDAPVENEAKAVASDTKLKSHQEVWQGRWLGTYSEMKGESLDRRKNFTSITGNRFEAVDEDGKVLEKGTFKLDSTQKPHHYDIVVESLVEGEPPKSYSGIYRLFGNDKLLVSVNITPDGPRPTTFETANHPTHKLGMMERAKTLVNSSKDDMASEDESAGYLQVKDFVQNNLIGKVLETTVKSEIDHYKHGKSETDFFRRESFFNFMEQDDKKIGIGFGFEVLSVIEQTIWPLDETGKRTGEKIVSERFVVSRLSFDRSFVVNGAVGTRNVVTGTRGIRLHTNVGLLRATVNNNKLSVTEDIGLYDSLPLDGARHPKAHLTTSTFSIENNKLVMNSLEEQFRVDLETGDRTPADHRVELVCTEVESLMAPKK